MDAAKSATLGLIAHPKIGERPHQGRRGGNPTLAMRHWWGCPRARYPYWPCMPTLHQRFSRSRMP